MPFAEAAARLIEAPIEFVLPPELEAKEPAEVRGAGRDDVRLLVSGVRSDLVHARFRQLPDFLAAGDLVVFNRSATVPAALTALRKDRSSVTLHVSTRLPGDMFVVEVRNARMQQLERLGLPGGASAELLTPYRESRRLWVARLHLPGPFLSYLARYGQPIRYRHALAPWPLETYQNVYAAEPGSAEMPSAGRPFTHGLLRQLRDRGIDIAFIVLHAGVSSPERDEPPYEETYSVPAETADAVRRARRGGGRIVAVGTTVVRALESSLDAAGRVVASQGWTDVVVSPDGGVSTVDGVLTGFHEPRSSHLAMLEAIAGRDVVREAYKAALEGGYLWHEFGDSHLILKPSQPRTNQAPRRCSGDTTGRIERTRMHQFMRRVGLARVLVAATLLLVTAPSFAATPPSRAAAVEALAHRYYTFAWDASPTTTTVNGLHTADDRLADYSEAADRAYAAGLRGFRNELAALAPGGTTVHDQANYLLLRADIEGDYWVSTYLRPRERNPAIYEEECTNGIFSLLQKKFASNAVRAHDAASRMRQCGSVLAQGEHNLTDAVREFGVVASQELAGADPLFTQSLGALTPGLTTAQKADLYAARDQALVALHAYKRWVNAHVKGWHAGGFAVGKQQYDWMLRRVLLLPWDSDQLAQLARFELARDRALAAYERDHAAYSSGPVHHQPAFSDKTAFLHYYESQTAKVVTFVTSHHLITIPQYIGAFKIVELPKALAPIFPGGFMNPPGTFDRDQTGFYFVPNYDPSNTSFFAAQARQTVLPILAHEGIPGHFLQFSIAYKNTDFIRKVHGDGVFAEGWAFYGEEMLMRAGLYDDDPAARAAVIHLMRHRATRILVDIGLATGQMTLPAAIAFFQHNAGIDYSTAYGEGTRFAMGPGQAIDYLTGKSQIQALLAEAQDQEGAGFSIGGFHDKLLSFGTVPYSTIAWEWFGDSRWIDVVREPIAPILMH